MGETFGYLLTSAWTLDLLALDRLLARRWFTLLGSASALLILAGVLSPWDLPGVDLAHFLGYVLWSIRLVVSAGLLPRRPVGTSSVAQRSRPYDSARSAAAS